MPFSVHFDLGSLADWVSGLSTAAVLIWTIFETRKYSVPKAEVFATDLYSQHGPNPTFGIINHGRVTIGITGFQLTRKSDGSSICYSSFNKPPVEAVPPEKIYTHTIDTSQFKQKCIELGINTETEFEYKFIGTRNKTYQGNVLLHPGTAMITV